MGIPSTCNDLSCSYKIPRLIARIEGRGNGIKTSIVNMVEVSRAMNCPPQYPIEWFGYELGAKTTCTTKDGEGECFSIGGIYEVETLQPLLDKFIEKYLTCGSCCLPQVHITANHFMIQGKCKA